AYLCFARRPELAALRAAAIGQLGPRLPEPAPDLAPYLEVELAELPRIAKPQIEAHRLLTGQAPLEIEPVEAGWQLMCTGCGEVSVAVPYRWQVLDQTVTCRCA